MYRIESVSIKLFNNVSKEVVDKSTNQMRIQNFSQLREPINVQVVGLVADLVFHQLIDLSEGIIDDQHEDQFLDQLEDQFLDQLEDQLFDLRKDQHNG